MNCGIRLDLTINFSLGQYLFDYLFLMIFHLFMFSLSLSQNLEKFEREYES